MTNWRYLIGLSLLVFFSGLLNAAINPQKILILANENSGDSVKLAKYYAEKRSIPEQNIYYIDTTRDAEISWDRYVEDIFNPLLERLTKDGWIDADASDQKDPAGRYLYSIYGHQIEFMVTTFDVPLKIKHEPSHLPDPVPANLRKDFLFTNASVDSELGVLIMPESLTVAFAPNALYSKADPGSFSHNQVLRVSRLDGANYESAKSLVDNALLAEQTGLQGRAYIDYGYKHKMGDDWLEKASHDLADLGYGITYNDEKELFDWDQRFDAPAFYFGWWAMHPSGPIADPDFRFPPGAIAVHINSFSAKNLSHTDQRWVAPLVYRGATATIGNVYEPYLQMTHNIHLLMDGLMRGMSWGEAAYYSLPTLSWQAITVGDPLYQPFKVGLQHQITTFEQEIVPYGGYAVIRQMNLLAKYARINEAIDYGKSHLKDFKDIALAHQVALFQQATADPEGAIETLRFVDTQVLSKYNHALVADCAVLIAECGKPNLAIDILDRIVNADDVMPAMERRAVKLVIDLCEQTGRDSLLNIYKKKLEEIRSSM